MKSRAERREGEGEAVRYRISAAPIATGLCQCDRCRPQSGGAYSTITIINRSTFEIEVETLDRRPFVSKTTPEQNKALVVEAFDNPLQPAQLRRCRTLLVGPLHPAQRAHRARPQRSVQPDPHAAGHAEI
jgi:hypothetical protein